MANVQRSVELFHLLFLQQLSDKLEKTLYAVKGGCNLRFFFKSIRYSEDLDIDVKTVARETLRNKVHKLLESQPFHQVLATRGLELEGFSEPKQTDTTQRWKMSINLPQFKVRMPTKIEFSRRTMDEVCLFESIDPEVLQKYQLYPILINHYSQEAAFCQKINALIHRTEVQARDVFDIHLLLDRGVQLKCLPASLNQQLNIAIENTLSIDFSSFKAQVVAYLMDEYQEYYNSPQIWDQMQNRVVTMLEGVV